MAYFLLLASGHYPSRCGRSSSLFLRASKEVPQYVPGAASIALLAEREEVVKIYGLALNGGHTRQ
ncbi:MAG: hypothetical protein ACT4P4_03405 [Betaproteobacteria bacterium]